MPDPEAIDRPNEGAIELAPGVSVLPGALRFQFARSSGPGGQNVNKLNTKAELWVSVSALRGISEDSIGRLMLLAGRRLTRQGEIHLAAEASRSQETNRQAVLDRLRELLIAAMHRPRPRRKTRPSRASRQKRLNAKKHRGEIKSGRRGLED